MSGLGLLISRLLSLRFRSLVLGGLSLSAGLRSTTSRSSLSTTSAASSVGFALAEHFIPDVEDG